MSKICAIALGYFNLEGGRVHKSAVYLPKNYTFSEIVIFFFPHWKQNIGLIMYYYNTY